MTTETIQLSIDEWNALEKNVRELTRKWAQLNLECCPSEDRSFFQHFMLITSSQEEFSNDWKRGYWKSADFAEFYEDFRYISPLYTTPESFIKDAIKTTDHSVRQLIHLDRRSMTKEDWNEHLTQSIIPFPNGIMRLDHAYYALYVAWRPDSKILVPNNRLELLRALAVDNSILRIVSPRQFEELIAYLYECLGYKVTLTKQTRDFGADILVWHGGPLSMEALTAVQVKLYAPNRRVGLKGIYELHGAVSHYHADTGCVITSSDFTQPAKDFAKLNEYQLINLGDFQKELNQIFR